MWMEMETCLHQSAHVHVVLEGSANLVEQCLAVYLQQQSFRSTLMDLHIETVQVILIGQVRPFTMLLILNIPDTSFNIYSLCIWLISLTVSVSNTVF